MKLTNSNMILHLKLLKNISTKVNGRLAYAVAKNIRKLTDELYEFEMLKENYIHEHGKLNEDGYYSIDVGSEEYNGLLSYLHEYIDLESDVDIMMVLPDDIYSSTLNADEILNLDFMIKDDKDPE